MEEEHLIEIDEIPCEFCEMLFPMDLIMEHMSLCGHEEIQNSFLNKDNSYDSDSSHDEKEDISDSEGKEDIKTVTNSSRVKVNEINLRTSDDVLAKLEEDIRKVKLDKTVSISTQKSNPVSNLPLKTEIMNITSEDETSKKKNLNSQKHQMNSNDQCENRVLRLDPNINIKNQFSENSNNYEFNDEDAQESLESFWEKAKVELDKRLGELKK